MRNDNVINVVINVVKVDTHFATKSELFVVKKGSFGVKKELFIERILLRKRDFLVQNRHISEIFELLQCQIMIL